MKKRIMTGNAMIKRFKESSAPVLNVDNIHIYKGDFTIIMGASGAGKSTLLYALSGMQHLDEGQVLYRMWILSDMMKSRWHSFAVIPLALFFSRHIWLRI